MLYNIYIIIIIYFLFGALGFYFINRKKTPDIARQNRIKYISYFIIINILFFSIVINPVIFRCLAVLIILAGTYEIISLFVKSGFKNPGVFSMAIIVLGINAIGFYVFSTLEKELILFTFLILSIFDSFSQISGQLFGHRKIIPSISPNKTFGGLIGGLLAALISSFLLSELYPQSLSGIFLTTTGIITFAFIGDISTSYYKRKYQVKDFNNLIPGHGGFLDRFDSLIVAGTWMAFTHFLMH